MALEVMIVNGDRYVLNVDSKHVDKTADEIISQYPQEPTLEWDSVRDIDLTTNTHPWDE
jgi:hypothetical protein